MYLQPIIDDCNLTITGYHPVPGGDINGAYCLYNHETKYFLKINAGEQYPHMFEQEAKGLQALHANCPLNIPQIIKSGRVGQQQYLLLEWIEKGTPKPGFWQNFGSGMALLHLNKQPFLGWTDDNFIGTLTQHNPHHAAWHSFYTECRIIPLVKNLFNRGVFSKLDLVIAELFCNRIEQLFPAESPALLHGDLWSGNFMTTTAGYASIFDPAVYFGHREMDIGMTKLFGGFDQKFYNAYDEMYPLEKGWRNRLLFTQLYPLLVHANLFGGHYVNSARDIIKPFAEKS